MVDMEIRLLGSVELRAHGEQIRLPSIKAGLLFAALLWDVGRVVSTSTLVERVWGDDAPAKAPASIQSYASKLRKCLDACGEPSADLSQISTGYRLLVPAECIDRVQFEHAASLADAAVSRGNLPEAMRLLRSAEALVRGEEPLTGLFSQWAIETRSELEERIREVVAKRISIQMKLGDARAVLPELRRLATKHEFDESILGLLMRALQMVGRTTDGLDVFAIYQARLRDQTGLEPRTELRKIQDELLRADPVSARLPKAPAPVRTPPPNTLDREPSSFVGRRQDVEAITAEIESQLDAGTSVVFAIEGMPAVGKTTLALHLAYRLRDRCPDGAVQLNLRSHDERQRPTDAETALGLLLGMLGTESREIQRAGNLDLAIALFRKYTSGRRLLLLLDDADKAEQIAPLIPSGDGHIVLITARNRLTGLPEAIRHPLAPMLVDEGTQLFLKSAGMSPTTDPALSAVVTACAGIPMALALVGSTFRARQSWSLGDLAEHLANSRATPMRKPDAITASLFRMISTSYRDLPELERVLLRRLSLNPGLRTHLFAAAALADAEPSETDAALFNLVEQNLLLEPERRYYQLHDMIRIFASHECGIEETPDEREAATTRLVYYAVGAVDAATKLAYPHRQKIPIEKLAAQDFPDAVGLTDAGQASRWLTSEQQWLLTVIEHWFADGHRLEAATIVNMLSKSLDRKNLWKESIPLHESALAAWHEYENSVGASQALVSLATAHWRLGDSASALEWATQALNLYSSLGDENGCANALLEMGRAHHVQHHNAEAIYCFARSARHWRDVHDQQQAAATLQHLSAAQFDAGHYKQAIATVKEALELANQCEDLAIRSNCLNNLGLFMNGLGDHSQAEHYYQRALLLADHIGDGNRIAAFALNVAICEIRLDRPESALPLLERAHETFASLDDQYYLTSTLIAQAEAHLGLRRTRHASALIDSAALTAERLGKPIQLARLHVAYGRIHAAGHDYSAAMSAYRQALDFAREARVPYMQSVAYRGIGDLYGLMGDYDKARHSWRRALSAYGDIESPEVEILRQRLGLSADPS